MTKLKSVLSLTLAVGAAIAAPSSPYVDRVFGCGELDLIFTGLPPYHPLVISQGYSGDAVNTALRNDAANVMKAGYNLRVVLMGPEQNMTVLENQMEGINWDGTGIGYGVRGSHLQNLTIQFGDILQLYKERAPRAPSVFDYSPYSFLWAVHNRFPLSSNCTNEPGKDLGFNIFCDICTE